MKKQRLDLLLVERGIVPSRTAAQALIMAGKVKSGTTVLSKPGMSVDTGTEVTVEEAPRYVSRGGDKLASVAKELGLNFKHKVVLDVGSSTGGFTDYALQQGAVKVYAVDVGTSQLAYKLRQDPRVVVMEQTDIREAELPEPADLAVIDVSFVSLRKILQSVERLIKPGGQIIAMAKPQFESDRVTATKFKGVISDETVRQQILGDLEADIEDEFQILDSADSKVAGAQGNRERFYLLSKR
jgi:23S rRNA (cytidine1920-2'-O)/16S rRNA (cytidine1409-2'-O)-methyltransferase